jgi:hypothetical protein
VVTASTHVRRLARSAVPCRQPCIHLPHRPVRHARGHVLQLPVPGTTSSAATGTRLPRLARSALPCRLPSPDLPHRPVRHARGHVLQLPVPGTASSAADVCRLAGADLPCRLPTNVVRPCGQCAWRQGTCCSCACYGGKGALMGAQNETLALSESALA